MTSKAFSSQGFEVHIGISDAVLVNDDGSESFIEIGEVVDVDPPSPTRDTIDVTHMKSDIKEFISGLMDGGSATLNCNFIPDDAGQLECREAFTAGQLRNFRFDFNTTLTPNRLKVKGVIVGMPQKASTNDKAGLSVSIKVSSIYSWVNQ